MKLRPFQIFPVLLLFAASVSVYSQSKPAETYVQILRKSGGTEFYCTAENGVMTEESFDKLIAQKQCSGLKILLNVDFQTESLIAFHARGDCKMRVSTNVFRSDEAKKYTVRIGKRDGGCRAAGSYQGWLVVDKLKAGYAVEFTETSFKEIYKDWNPNEVIYFVSSIQDVETKPIDLKGCIQTSFVNEFVIQTQYKYLKSLRRDAGNNWCLQNLAPVDFEKNSLLGIGMTSDYCGIPQGLEYKLTKDTQNKQYLFKVSYLKTESLCRHVGHYDLWLLVPKLEENYPVKFDLEERPR